MNSSVTSVRPALATAVAVSDDTLTVDLADGRKLRVPLAWYPRLTKATPAERSRWRLVGRGEGIHWPDLDEDIRIDDLLEGRASAESEESLTAWRASRGDRP